MKQITLPQEIGMLRKKIDEIDGNLVSLLDQRLEMVRTIGDIKAKTNMPVLDGSREQEVLDKTKNARNSFNVKNIFNTILKESKDIQKKTISIGIIGFGNFGKLAAKHLSKLDNIELFVTDINNESEQAGELGVKFVSLNEILTSRFIILAVPMENLEQILLKIKDKIEDETIVLDVCSLKVFSCKLMNQILPKDIEIIGTHPLFGPQSAPDSINGMRIALCNVRATNKTFDMIKEFCEFIGLQTTITTPEEHDKQMALSQALTHFIGQALNKAGIKRVELSTKTFDKLMDIVEIIANDTPALFNNMQIMNPFAKEARQIFINGLNNLEGELK
ncbi:MAG: prephenate dehydrogenase/arogenate dehydrogenase family protein [Candidatus Pacearchaeota archaeon]